MANWIKFLTILFLLNLSPLVLCNFWGRLKNRVTEASQAGLDQSISSIDHVIQSNPDLQNFGQTGIIEPFGTHIIEGISIFVPPKSPTITKTSPLAPIPETSTRRSDCMPTITEIQGKELCKNDLVFEDNFDNLNRQIWKPEVQLTSESEDAEFVLYHPENCYVENGKLHIVPKLITEFPGFNEERLRTGQLNLGAQCTGATQNLCRRRASGQAILPPVVSCKLNTKSKFAFKYGKIEIRAKLPKGDWILPQLYLEPLENAYGGHDYASGQMRVGFIRGNEMLISKDNLIIDGSLASGGLILSPRDDLRDNFMKSVLMSTHLGSEYHNYTLTWTDQKVSIGIDGVEYGNIRSSTFRRQAQANNISYSDTWNSGDAMAPFDKDFYLSLGVAVGGMVDFPDLSKNGILGNFKPWNNTSPDAEAKFWLQKDNWYSTWTGVDAAMKVDYVKVWAV